MKYIADSSPPSRALKNLVLFLTCIALLFELVKVAVFLQINFCTHHVWLDSNDNSYKLAESCNFGRGAWASLVSVVAYAMITIILSCDMFLNEKERRYASGMSFA